MARSKDVVRSLCPICGDESEHSPHFKVAFPKPLMIPAHDGEPLCRQAFELTEFPPIPVWTMFTCVQCGVVHPVPHPRAEDIVRFYAQQQAPTEWEIEHYVNFDAARQAGARAVAQRLTALNGGPGTLLEVGCAAGWVLASARDLGWQVQGVEAAPKFSAFARQRHDLPIHAGTVTELGPEHLGRYDVVYAADVVEHLADPVGDLTNMGRLLKSGGRLVVTVPRIDSFFARFYGIAWRQAIVSHVCYFTAESITLAMARAGLTMTTLSEPRYWHPVASLERRQRLAEIAKLTARAGLLTTYVPMSRAAARRGWETKWQDFVHRVSRGRLTHLDLLFKIGEQPVLGDVMLVVARPDPISS